MGGSKRLINQNIRRQMIFILFVIAVLFYAVYSPSLDYTREKKLLLWYDTVDKNGLKTRTFKILL